MVIYAEKLQAEEVALRVNGVRALATEIEVRQPNRKQRADTRSCRAVDIISWNTALPEGTDHVKVEDGCEADWSVPSVSIVENHIHIG